MNEGDIALASLPQADGQTKNRPVLLLRRLPPYGDFLVCGVSTQLQQRVPDFDELIVPRDRDFGQSGLKAESVVRLGFLAALPEKALLGTIGSISRERHRRLLANLSRHLSEEPR